MGTRREPRLHVRLDEQTMLRIEADAKLSDTSASWVVRRIVAAHFRQVDALVRARTLVASRGNPATSPVTRSPEAA